MKVFSLLVLVALVSQCHGDSYTFRLIPKQNADESSFFASVQTGCTKGAASITTDSVTCEFEGPAVALWDNQKPYVQAAKDDLCNRTIDGFGFAVLNSDEAVVVLAGAGADEGCGPVTTFDSDLNEKDWSQRWEYVGTNNYDMGQDLAFQLYLLGRGGGKYSILTAVGPNLDQRIQGLKDRLASFNDGTPWTELERKTCNEQPDNCQMVLEQLAIAKPDAIIAIAGWPLFGTDSADFQAFVRANRHIRLVWADTVELERAMLAAGYLDALTGQRPEEMGFQSIVELYNFASGKTPRPESVALSFKYTGEELLTGGAQPPLGNCGKGSGKGRVRGGSFRRTCLGGLGPKSRNPQNNTHSELSHEDFLAEAQRHLDVQERVIVSIKRDAAVSSFASAYQTAYDFNRRSVASDFLLAEETPDLLVPLSDSQTSKFDHYSGLFDRANSGLEYLAFVRSGFDYNSVEQTTFESKPTLTTTTSSLDSVVLRP